MTCVPEPSYYTNNKKSHMIFILYKIPQVVIGENETFKGPEDYSQSKGVNLINLDMSECKDMMKSFIEKNPTLWNEDIGV